jgi:hypothetical protein
LKLWHLHHSCPLSKLICMYPWDFVAFLAHGVQSTCDDDGDCSNAIPTYFNFL